MRDLRNKDIVVFGLGYQRVGVSLVGYPGKIFYRTCESTLPDRVWGKQTCAQ
jgi:hypothetical protein